MKLCVICAFIFVSFVVHFSCGYSSCKTPSLLFGRIRSRQRGKSVKFLCNLGYQLAGDRTAFCINGSWDVPIPKCVRATCPKKEKISPKYGVALTSLNGAVVMFYCQQGYEINGPGTIYCDGFKWDNSIPSCIASNTKPSLFCDFENEDICHWTQDINHDMDWVRDNYYTPTGSSMPTGPSFDHTKGKSKNGHYMYLESSSRRINDTARLISPIFGKMDGRVCLEFWYHMYGKTIGILRAYIKKISDPWPLKSTDAIFSKSGNQGNVWLREIIDMGHIPEDFQIVLEGVRGNGYVSDMAVDDIRLIPNCNIEDYIQSTTEFVPSSTEVIKTIDTCENRCGHKAYGNESAAVIACDCDDFCFENSRCCPDVDRCFDAFSTTESSTTPEAITEDMAVETTVKFFHHQYLSKQFSPSSTPLIPKTSLARKANTIPTLVILQPATTPYIVEKILLNISSSKNDSKIIFVKPKKSTTPMAYHDDIDVPIKPLSNDEMMPLLSSPSSIQDNNEIMEVNMEEKEEDVEEISHDKDYPFQVVDEKSEHVGEFKTDLEQIQKHETNMKSVLITIGIVGGIIMLGIFIGVALIKFRFIRVRNRRINSGQGDSQSDVRFLTADEVLDFTLDRDYDDL